MEEWPSGYGARLESGWEKSLAGSSPVSSAMRIIFLNIWHGMLWKGLKDFIQEQSKDTDIFCFLEVDPRLQSKLVKILPKFDFYYSKGIKTGYLEGIYEGRSIFVNKDLKILKGKKVKLFNTYKFDAGGMIYLELTINNNKLTLGCVHGKARPGTKLDTPIRIKQSQKIIEFFRDKSGPKIIGGDFNLNPDTKSVAMFEKVGYKNLVKEHGIKNTRNKISWSNFSNDPNFVKQYFADYCFVSKEVKVKKFEVPYNEISDHLPLILDFEL